MYSGTPLIQSLMGQNFGCINGVPVLSGQALKLGRWLQMRPLARGYAMPMSPNEGVANGTSKNIGLGKFWQDLEISEAFLTSLEISFLHGLFLLFLSLETFYQRVSGSDF